jgi:hypothetical protein
MQDTITPRYRVLLVWRGLLLGLVWGAVSGAVALTVLCLWSAGYGGLVWLIGILIACLVGAVVGGGIGVVASLALAFSGSRVIRRMYRARLVTGAVAAAVPLVAALQLHRPRPLIDYLVAAGLAAVAALAAVLLTPRLVNGAGTRRATV